MRYDYKTGDMIMGFRWVLALCVIGLMGPGSAFGGSIVVSGHSPEGTRLFKEGTLELPLLVNAASNPGAFRDGLNHVAVGYGGGMYDPGEPFGRVWGDVGFPIGGRSFFPEVESQRNHQPSWVGQGALLSLDSGFPRTSSAGIGTFSNVRGPQSLTPAFVGVTLRGTQSLTPAFVEVTLRGTITSPHVSQTPLPAGVWLFASGLGLLGLLKRRMKQVDEP